MKNRIKDILQKIENLAAQNNEELEALRIKLMPE